MLSSRCALTGGFWDTQQQQRCSSLRYGKTYKGREGGRTAGDGLLPPAASQSATHLLPAQSSCPLSPDWGSTILSLPLVNTEVLKAPPSAAWKTSQTIGWSLPVISPWWLLLLRYPWAPQNCTTSSLWMRELTLVCKGHLGGENTHRKV